MREENLYFEIVCFVSNIFTLLPMITYNYIMFELMINTRFLRSVSAVNLLHNFI